MATQIQSPQTLTRVLNINFTQLTEGDDAFKKEILSLMVKNLEELQGALHASLEQKIPEPFSKACHKTKITLSVLNDDEFHDVTAELSHKIKSGEYNGSATNAVRRFDELSASIIHSLRIETGLA